MGKTEVPPPIRGYCKHWGWDGELGYCTISEKKSSCNGSTGWCIVRINEKHAIEYLEQKSW